jgi:microcystin-dependent protein
MATALQLRRGTTAQNNSFTGAAGELSYDTATEGLRVHDGSTAGGFEILPSGSILPFGGTAAPTAAFLLCNGANVSRSTYARLFAVVGTAYGAGDGSSTFGLPDLRDRVPLGKGSNNSTLGAETGSAAASSVITNATSNTGTSNTGTGTTGTANTGTGNTGTGTTGTGTSGTGTTGTATSGSTGSTTSASNSGTGTSGSSTSLPSAAHQFHQKCTGRGRGGHYGSGGRDRKSVV